MCCATNRTSDADTCLANGLCQNISPSGQNTGYDLLLWRESCSDPTWKSPYCLNLCTQGHGESVGIRSKLCLHRRYCGVGQVGSEYRDYSNNALLVLQCNDGSFCCGQFNTSCCDRGDGVHIANILGSAVSIPTSSATATLSASSPSSMSASATTTPKRVANSKQGFSSSIKVGIGVGVTFGILVMILVGILAWFIIRGRKRLDIKSHNNRGPTPVRTILCDLNVKLCSIATLTNLHFS